MRLSHDTYLGLIRADARRMHEVAGRGLDPPVPSCPGWTVRDVVEHTAEVYQHKLACIRQKAFPEPWPPERDDTPTLEHFTGSLDELTAELAGRDPLEFAETWWWDERTVGFWARRMAHETAIHRVDVELGHAAVTDIDDALAVDGVDEVLRRMLTGDWSDEPVDDRPGATVRVRCGEHSWRVVLEPSAAVAQVDRWPDLPVDAVVSGYPGVMYLWLWGRGPRDELSVDGDADAVRALDVRMRLATE